MITYEIDTQRRIILARASDSLTPDDVKTHVQRLTADPEFDPSYNTVLHIDSSVALPRSLQIDAMREVLVDYAGIRRGTKWAVLVENSMHRAIVSVIMRVLSPPGIQIKVHAEYQAALDWLDLTD